jgi:RNA polymerase sigma factor (sigma-70 family)
VNLISRSFFETDPILKTGEASVLDKSFIEKIYREYYSLIKLVVINSIHSSIPDDISSCIQDVFMAAMKQEDLKEHISVKGWLLKTTTIVTNDFNRKQARREKHIDHNAINYKYAIKSESGGTIEKDIDVFEADFSESIIENEELTRLKRLNYEKVIEESLFKSERDFFELIHYRKKSIDEICEILHISKGSAMVRRTRLKGKIKKILENM